MQHLHGIYASQVESGEDVEIDPCTPHSQLAVLYKALLRHPGRFEEFKYWLSLYQSESRAMRDEPEQAARVRGQLNQRIAAWIGAPFSGLCPTELRLWHAIVIDGCWNIAPSAWRESSPY